MNGWLLARLREPSTWRGLVWLATVAGLSLRPDQAEAIVTVGMALAGLLGVLNPRPSRSNSRRLICKVGARRRRAPTGTRRIWALALCSLLTSCACTPSADPARLERRIPIPTPGSVLDSGIAINCAWSF